MDTSFPGDPGRGILVVDDTLATLQTLTSILTGAGYSVRSASDGNLALHSAWSQPPDLILLDGRMPDLDGFEVCRRLKADERTRSIPIIFTTERDEVRDEVCGFQLGAVDFIADPFDRQEVLARVSTHLALQQTQMELQQANWRLTAEVSDGKPAETAPHDLDDSLEQRILVRTAQVEATNRELRTEIAARQRTEEALRASEARYRELADENGRLLEQSRQDAETKAILLHEVNHRVKNNLAAIIGLLQLELRYLEDEQQTPYRSLVEDLTSRIQSLALVHNLLSASQWAPLPLDKLAANVMQIAPIMLSGQRLVHMDISPTSVQLTPKQASAVALILNELATNSLKHALRTDEPICISLMTSQSGEEVHLEYRDNGPGYPDEALQGRRRSVGLYLVEALAEHDLEGQLTLSNDPGAVARFHFTLTPGVQALSPQAADPAADPPTESAMQ